MKYWLAILLVLLPRIAWAIPVFTVSSSATTASVTRIGLNLGNASPFSESNFTQNYLFDPGFEPGEETKLADVASSPAPTSSTFTDSQDNGEATNFWSSGLTNAASVRIGAHAGDNLTITGFTSGGAYTYGSCTNSAGSSITCPTLNAGEWLAIKTKGLNVANYSNNFGYNWGPGDSDVALSTTQKYEGLSSLAFNVSGGASHSATYDFDTTITTGGVCTAGSTATINITPCVVANATADCGSGGVCGTAPYVNTGPWHQMTGSMEMAFWALGSGTSTGTPTVEVAVARAGQWSVSHTFTLINDGAWHQYYWPFTGSDIAAYAQDEGIFTLTASNGSAEAGAVVYVDDVYLGPNSAASTGWNAPALTALRAINPGSVRDMVPLQLFATDDYLEGLSGCTPGAVGLSGYTNGGCDFLVGFAASFSGTSYVNDNLWDYTLTDAWAVANQLGSKVWVSIGNTMSDADLRTLINNACTNLGTYSNVPAIYIEQSNEDWNGAGPGPKFFDHADPTAPAGTGLYGELAGRNFSIMSAEVTSQCSALASKFFYVMGNQVCNNGVITAALTGATYAGFGIPNTAQYGTDDATYNDGGTTESGNLPNYSGSLASQAAQYAAYFMETPGGTYFSPSTCVSGDQAQIGASNFLAVYETGAGAQNPPGTTEQSYLAQAGFPSAAWMALTWMLGTQQGVPIQNSFTFTQVETFLPASPYDPMWGIAHDLNSAFTTYPHLRPIALGEELLNSVMAGGYYASTNSGLASTCGTNGTTPCQVLVTFKNGSSWTAALVNASSSSQQVQVDFPAGAVPTVASTVLNTNGITDNDEDSDAVYLGCLGSGTYPNCSGGASVSGQDVTVTLPPFSLVALEQPAAGTGGASAGVGWW